MRSKIPTVGTLNKNWPSFIPDKSKLEKYEDYIKTLQSLIKYETKLFSVNYSFQFDYYKMEGKVVFPQEDTALVYIEDKEKVYVDLFQDLKLQTPIYIPCQDSKKARELFYDLILCNVWQRGLLC